MLNIREAQKEAEKLIGNSASVEYDYASKEYIVGLLIEGDFITYGSSPDSWEKALEETRKILNKNETDKM